MYESTAKILQRMTPKLQRVLVCDSHMPSARLLGELMRTYMRSQVWMVHDSEKAIKLAAVCDPQIIFIELAGEAVDGLDFTRRLRRSTFACRFAPVIVVSGRTTAASILAARDAGVHEVLAKPFATKDLLRRLEAVTLRDRDWVEAVGYIGPDRRRFNSGDYKGPLKRRSDTASTPDSDRLIQAFRIFRSALGHCEADPHQALRSMLAQVAELQRIGTARSDVRLTTTALAFERYLNDLQRSGRRLPTAELRQEAAQLLELSPEEVDEAA